MERIFSVDIKEGMVLSQPIYDPLGRVLIGKGSTLSERYIENIRNLKIPFVFIRGAIPADLVDDGNVITEDVRMAMVSELERVLKGAQKTYRRQGKATLSQQDINRVLKMGKDIHDEVRDKKGELFQCNYIPLPDDTLYAARAVDAAIITSMMMWLTRNVPEQEAFVVLGATLLRDIGRVEFEDDITSAEELGDEEFKYYNSSHPERGGAILKRIYFFESKLLHLVASEHHERINGEGVPLGKKGEKIFRHALSVGIVDDFIRVTSSYKSKRRDVWVAPSLALDYLELQTSKGFFPAKHYNTLVQVVAPFPVGTRVELSSAEVGVVIGQTEKADPDSGRFTIPRVFLLLDKNKKDISAKGRVVDLSQKEEVKIKSVIDPFP